jgi:formate hydrogenlyase subunit 4
MRVAVGVVQGVLLIMMAPLVRGGIARLKARIQNRQGASILRPYQDLLKLFRKEDLAPPTASALFRAAPVVLFAATVVAAFFVPVLQPSALVGMNGDFVLLVSLLALARFALMLGAIDGGSAFGGMGASREALVSTLAEAPLLLALTAMVIAAHSATIAGATEWMLQQDLFQLSAVQPLACAAMVLVAIAETGRIPVDNPTTHLELTMIHEAMILEYSGPSLALIEWASALKLTVIMALLIGLFSPWGMTLTVTAFGVVLAVATFLLKVVVLIAGIALLESAIAKLRMYVVPDFLGVASALSILAVVFTGLMR